MKKLVIDESKWYRGNGTYASRLRRVSDGQMCCLGFLCLAAGATKDQITDVGTPFGVFTREPTPAETEAAGWNELTYAHALGLHERSARSPHTVIGSAMAYTNDTPAISDEERKRILTQDFAQIGWEVEFVPGEQYEEASH